MYKSVDCCYIPVGLYVSVIQAEWSRRKVLCCVLVDLHASVKERECMSVDCCYVPVGLYASVIQAEFSILNFSVTYLLSYMPTSRKEIISQ